MTVGTLIKDLRSWIESGYISEDSPVYTCRDIMPFDESEMFESGFVGGHDVFFDDEEPARQAIFITCGKRVPTMEIKGKKWIEYGTGSDSIVYEKKIPEKRIELDIARKQVEALQEGIKRVEAELDKKKRPSKKRKTED